jgi:hypothetical protein
MMICWRCSPLVRISASSQLGRGWDVDNGHLTILNHVMSKVLQDGNVLCTPTSPNEIVATLNAHCVVLIQ